MRHIFKAIDRITKDIWDMKQIRFLLTLMALMGLTATAQNYGIKIGDVAVTPSNYSNITS